MEITGTKELPVSRKEVWDALHNEQLLCSLIKGCESLEWTSDSTLEGVVTAKFGPVKAKFLIDMAISNSIQYESYTMTGEAKSKAQGFAGGAADVQLADSNGGCELSYQAEFKIGGKIAQLGSRLMSSASRKIIDSFFDRLTEALSPESTDESESSDSDQNLT